MIYFSVKHQQLISIYHAELLLFLSVEMNIVDTHVDVNSFVLNKKILQNKEINYGCQLNQLQNCKEAYLCDVHFSKSFFIMNPFGLQFIK